LSSQDPYKILGLPPSARPEEIRHKYKQLARQYHPDVNPSPEAEELFKELAMAFSVLTDPRRRALYDEFGEASLRLGFNPAEARRSRAENGAYGPRGGAARTDRDSEADLVQPLEIDLGTAIRGGELRVPSPLGGAPIPVTVPPGVESGARLCLAGRGLTSRAGGRPGDLYLEIRVLPNHHYRRDGLDLHLELPITLGEASHGVTLEVPAPGGRLRLTVPPDCKGGETLHLQGKGLRSSDGTFSGDLLVHLSVRLPAGTGKARRALDQLSALYREPVRGNIKL
jgi:DnaJ-class molecular chaperone